MKAKFIPGLVAGLLLASSALFAGPRVAIGIGIGVPVAPSYYVAPAPVPAYVPPVYPALTYPAYAASAYVPPAYVAPAPGYSWVSGYWYFSAGRSLWRPGYWAAPRYRGYVGHGWRYR